GHGPLVERARTAWNLVRGRGVRIVGPRALAERRGARRKRGSARDRMGDGRGSAAHPVVRGKARGLTWLATEASVASRNRKSAAFGGALAISANDGAAQCGARTL